MFKHIERLLVAVGEVQMLAPLPLSRTTGTVQQRVAARAHRRLEKLGRRMHKACREVQAAHA